MKVDIVEQVDLTPLNTLALPATSRHFATVDSLAALQWLLSIARERHWPLLLSDWVCSTLCWLSMQMIRLKPCCWP